MAWPSLEQAAFPPSKPYIPSQPEKRLFDLVRVLCTTAPPSLERDKSLLGATIHSSYTVGNSWRQADRHTSIHHGINFILHPTGASFELLPQ